MQHWFWPDAKLDADELNEPRLASALRMSAVVEIIGLELGQALPHGRASESFSPSLTF